MSKNKESEGLASNLQESEKKLREAEAIVESKYVEINDLVSRDGEYKVKLQTLEKNLEEAESSLTNQLQGNKEVSAAYESKVILVCSVCIPHNDGPASETDLIYTQFSMKTVEIRALVDEFISPTNLSLKL